VSDARGRFRRRGAVAVGAELFRRAAFDIDRFGLSANNLESKRGTNIIMDHNGEPAQLRANDEKSPLESDTPVQGADGFVANAQTRERLQESRSDAQRSIRQQGDVVFRGSWAE